MSEKLRHPATYDIMPEPYADLETAYYDLQEYCLLQSLTELGVDQFESEGAQPIVDVQSFVQFRADTLNRPTALLTRKVLIELKVMGSVDFADCYEVVKNINFGLIEREVYDSSFRFAPRRHNA